MEQSAAMWVEAVLLGEDLDRLVSQFAPMTIPIGAGHMVLSAPAPSALVPDVGLRVTCKARVSWPVLGIDVPVTIQSLVVLVRPTIVAGPDGQALVVTVEIESVDLAGVPKMVEEKITERVNADLGRRQVELSWNFARTLSHSFSLPESIRPLASLDLRVLAARLRVMADGVGLAVQLQSAVERTAD
jgi:hypothetical protein